jgi:tRNA-splicing ligase RtcB
MTLNKGRVPVKVFTNDIEHEALQQLINVASLPIVFGHVAAMPDVHHGIGATVGSVIATKQAIIPAAVGVDIGCGMNAVRLSLTANDLPESLAKIRSAGRFQSTRVRQG